MLVRFPCKRITGEPLPGPLYYEPVEFVRRRVEDSGGGSAHDYLYLADCYQRGLSVPFDPQKCYRLIRKCYILNKRGAGCKDMAAADIKCWLAGAIYDGQHQGYSDASTIVAELRLCREAEREGSKYAVDLMAPHINSMTIRGLCSRILRSNWSLRRRVFYLYRWL